MANDGIDALLKAAAFKDEQLLIELETIRVEEEIRQIRRELTFHPTNTSTPAYGPQRGHQQTAAIAGAFNGTRSDSVNQDVPNPNPPLGSTVSLVNNSDLALAIQSLAEVCSKKNKGLPKQEPEVFKGDAFGFPVWMNAFKVLVEDRYSDPTDRLYYLGRYTEGRAKEPIKGLLLLNTADAYDKAKYILSERFGNKLRLAQSFRQKIANWKIVHTGPEIQEFSDFLNQCLGAMSSLGQLSVLNDPLEQEKVISRLPRNMQIRWYANVDKWQHRVTSNNFHDFGSNDVVLGIDSATRAKDETPPFADLCTFIEREARVLSNPLLEQQTSRGGASGKSKPQGQQKPNAQGITKFSTSFAASSSSGSGSNVQKSANKPPTPGVGVTKKTSPTCVMCKGSHLLDSCSDFKGKTLAERVEFVKNKALCFGCLRWGHRKVECRSKQKCAVCSSLHPTVLHDYSFKPVANANGSDVKSAFSRRTEVQPGPNEPESGPQHCHEYCHSLIIPVFLRHGDKPDESMLIYALLDDQSDTSFVTNSVLNKLQVTGPKSKVKLATVLGEDIVECQKIDGLMIRGMRESTEVPLRAAYSRSEIPANPCQIPRPETAAKWEHLTHVASQLVPYLPELEIGLLIGASCSRALRPLEIAAGGEDDPYGLRTVLGWGVVGSMQHDCAECNLEQSNTHFTFRTSVKEVSPAQVSRMFDLDFSDKAPNEKISQEDRRFQSIVQGGLSQCDDGHLQLPLPFKAKDVKLPNNRPAALKRVNQLRSKMRKNEKFKADYTKFMEELFSNGHAEKVPDCELGLDDGTVWYLPHHGIYHPHKPGKIRVVFDASAEYKGEVLNRHLLQGPDMTNNLTGVLLRFRKEPVALTCDIKKMFYQVRVDPPSRNFLRFLWFENGDPDAPLVEGRMTVHPFGNKSSPGVANFALKSTADMYRSSYGDEVSDFIKNDFYVDDGLKSLNTTEDAISLALKSRDLCAEGGFTLCQFRSNSETVMRAIPEESRAQGSQSIDLHSTQIERALGVVWHLESDTFQFHIELRDQPLTRRGILSTVSSVFDPLGLVSPFVLRGKKILQELCRSSEWDDPVPEECRVPWERWRSELTVLANLKIPRCYKPGLGRTKSAELHHFSDASVEGYGQCSFLKLTDVDGETCTSLVMAKSRVAPSKTVTIPRLELTAAAVSVRISSFVEQELQFPEDMSLQNYYYTDSKVVLGYIANESKRFHIFVANRVQQIRDATSVAQWRHVPTKSNPADLASRGMRADEMIDCDLWWKGPDFLRNAETIPPPSQENIARLRDDDPEVKRTHVVLRTGAAEVVYASMVDRLKTFSSWFRLKRAVAICRRYIRILRDRITGNVTRDSPRSGHQPVDVEEMNAAEELVVRCTQEEAFATEMRTIRKARMVEKSSALYCLDPYLDERGLLRVGGRLKQSKLPRAEKNPVLMPRDHWLTKLLIDDCHRREAHSGRGITLNSTRQRGYWILGGRKAVSSFILNCIVCRKLRGACCGQKMADLPEDRLDPAPAFTYSGIDYFGPYIVKEGRKELKRWGVLFTCLSSRAIHLETANSLDTDSFLNAYRRFVCRRGPVRVLRCDRGSNFIGGKNEIDAALKEMDHDRITQELLKENCDWINFRMNFPHSSHMGGVWERMIGSARTVLSALLGQHGHQLDDELLRTLLAEVELVVNSRPLTYIDTNSPDSLEPLTPQQLLTLKSKVVMPPPGNFVREDLYCRRRWRRVQYLSNQFWTRWRKEFVPTLQTRKKWQNPSRNLAEGDIVLMLDDSLSRCQWPMARVVEVFPSQEDNLVRKVRVKVGKTTLERPVHKLVFLMGTAKSDPE